LGLAIARGIVSQHQGVIEVTSRLGEGSVFSITLPHSTRLQSPSRPLKILLVDDDPIDREAGRSRLAGAGHEVHCAVNGHEAISRLAHDGPFDVVILDTDMPELSGVDAFWEIRSAWQDQPIVLCCETGNSANQDAHNVLDTIPIEQRPLMIQKPFDMANVQRVLLTTLGAYDG
jgi:CheY-like chemotaxis protein